MSEARIIAALFNEPVPEGKVRWWAGDGQGGGSVEYVTPEESARRHEVLDAYYDADGPEPDWHSFAGPG